jgi:glycolate oxidase iron-sulfur subunit
VAYGELADIARGHLGPERGGISGIQRKVLKWMVPYPSRLRPLVRIGRWFRWMLPRSLANNLPAKVGTALRANPGESAAGTAGRVLLLNGCAQQVNTADTNLHLARMLGEHDIGVETIVDEACCGSLDMHLGDSERALAFVRHNVDALFPRLTDVDAIISSASGCGVTTKDYGHMLAHDPQYAEKAAAVAAKTSDVSEYLAGLDCTFTAAKPGSKVAWHSPCSLQHGQKIVGVVETLLTAAGYELTQVPDSHLCCGSAGTYSVLQPQMSERLKADKLAALCRGNPDIIATANVGCQTHMGAGSDVPVVHWIELLN